MNKGKPIQVNDTSSKNKDKGKATEVNPEKKSQFRWSNLMSRELLKFLANEVQKGNRPNNTFKTSSFVAAAELISKRFNTHCTPNHVDNHLKTVKSNWQIILKLRDNDSGFGWDDNLKMITASPTVFDAYVQENQGYEKFLNKKIDLYEEMAVVVGKDVARGSFAKSFVDINLDDEVESEEHPKEIDKQSISSNPEPTASKKGRKRSREAESELQMISTQLVEVATALKTISKEKVDIYLLYQELMNMEDFDEEFLGEAFDYLAEHETLGKTFLAKNDKLRRIWLQKFMEKGN